MHTSVLTSAALLAGAALAVSPTDKVCYNFTVPVTITSRNAVFGKVPVPQTNADATLFAQNMTRQGGNFSQTALSGYHTVNGTYDISAKYCHTSKNASAIQILTHGIGFDKTYWDLSFASFNYSYVDTALSAGYATLTYDRLGIGNSSHGDPRDEIQSFLEVEALAALTRKIRAGTISKIPKFSRVIHGGHSFGSGQTYALAAQYPDLSDGIVLTGFSMNSSFTNFFIAGADFQQAVLNQPLRFGSQATILGAYNFVNTFGLTDALAPIDLTTIKPINYSLGYLTNSNSGANQYLFLLPPYYNSQLALLGESMKQPVTIGEILTMGSNPMMNNFNKPVLVFTGSNDLPFCGGDCLNTGGAGASIPAAAKKSFPMAKPFEAYIQPNTGHGLNLHYNATAGYQYIQKWLAQQGLGSTASSNATRL